MCGILGFAGNVPECKWNETHDILTAMFLESETRGRDATGFVARTEPYKNPLNSDVVLSKQAIPASKFVMDSSWRALRHKRCNMVMGHVRWATHGSPADNFNNHPLVGHGGLYLVHNGVLTGHEATAERLGLELSTECDSETILRITEDGQHPSMGLNNALGELKGSMAAVVYDSDSDWLYFARNSGRPLWLLKMMDCHAWWFASTREILLAAFESVLGNISGRIELLMPLASGHVHALSSPPRSLVALSEVRSKRSLL